MAIKVSIIVPAYNTEEYMAECLDSVLNQTLEEIEVIAIDDGSTDTTLEILKRYEQQYPMKLKVFHKENGGLSSTRNFGLEHATGEYIGFVDSDDWVDAEMYEEMYAKAVSENADIVICDMVDHYPNREVYHDSSRFSNKFSVTPSACNKMFRREFIGNHRFPLGLWYEDLDFTTRQLMKTENISTIHKGFYHCHCRETSIMRNNNSLKNLDMLKILGNLEAFMRENQVEEKYSEDLEFMYIHHVLITTINRLENQVSDEKRKVIKQLIKEVRKKYPRFYKDSVFKSLPRNRQIIAFLNGIGLSFVSKMILSVKAKI